METELLRQKILDLAVRGKLVPQEAEDEPASVLLAQIKAEKEKLIKEKKLKKEKNPSYIFRGKDGLWYEQIGTKDPVCITDKIPFEIPDSWEWTYVGNIAFVTKLAGFEYTKYIAPNLCKEGIPLFKGKNVQDGKLVEQFESYIPEKLSDELTRSQITKKCLLLPYVGTIGNIAIYSGNYKAHLGSNVGKIELIGEGISEKFVLFYLKSCFGYKELTKTKKATAQESISIEAIRNVIIAVPPLAEQKRIVKKVETCFAAIKTIETNRDELEKLADSVKEKVLAAAVSGKLLAQDAADEPAAALLARIEAEKAALIKAKKLKKEKNPTRIVRGKNGGFFEVSLSVHSGRSEMGNGKWEMDGATDISDQLPFEIPESWEWVRLGTITYPVGNKNNQILAKEVKPEGSIPVVSQGSNLIDGYTDKSDKVIKDLPLIMFGDHTKNVKYIDFEFVIGADGTKFHKVLGCDVKYIYYWMIYAASKLRDRGYARHYTLLKESFIPLPPLAEQERIAARVREIFATLDELH